MVFTHLKSVSEVEYEDIFYESDVGSFPKAYLTSKGDKGIVIFVHGLEEIMQEKCFL